MCNTMMDSLVIPRPPALPVGSLVPTNYPLKGSPLPPPPPPPKPSSHIMEVQESDSKTTYSQLTRDSGGKLLEERKTIEERRFTQKLVEKNITRNESVRSRISNRSATSNGFRLKENVNAPNTSNNDDACSVYSIYKQKIDSMFESDSSTSTNTHNMVQAKIEKMFSEVAQDSTAQASPSNVHLFSVDYLGSVPLLDRVTSLGGLQEPLRDLYFSYKKLTKSKKVLSGRLEISPQGLRVQYQGSSGDLEQMNSFPSIAVWSAVKFVIQENSSMLHGQGLSYAFLPLITDPDNMDKQTLFKTLQEAEKQFIVNQQHSPLFTVVMRKFGVQKQLECHGFVCQTSEDAIVIAATLYKSLVNHMKNKERKPKNKNGVTTCMSTASSTIMDQNGNSMPVRPPRRKRSSAASSVCSDTNSNSNFNISDTQLLLPSKPPKKSTKSRKAPKAPDPPETEPRQEDTDAILPYEEPIQINHNQLENNSESKENKPKSFSDKLSTFMSKEQKELAAEMKKVVSDSTKGLKKVQSVRKRNEEALRKKENSGDIFTKVTIPRSGSFLNTGGLTRYKNKSTRNNESASGGSPLGFKEIFHELSMQEGLHSMDDILSVIIDPEGMSFNDLKPIYKEFLLKLAVTLTKDELYMKSRSIMRRQKKKMIKRSQPPKKNSNVIVSGKFKRLKHIFQKNLIQPPSKKLLEDNSKPEIRPCDPRIGSKLPESSISTSSYDTRPFRPKEELVGKKMSYRKKSHGENRRRDRASTSEESDFFSLKRQNKYNRSQNVNLLALNHTRNSSSGYVSCSECSYDSDTCTCTSADKCYCSLGNRNFENNRKKDKYICEDASLTYCDCDTDSCAESNKCYCQYGSQRRPKQRRNSSTKSHHANCTKMSQDDRHRKLCKKNSNTKSSRSLEYMSNPSEGYYEKLRSKQKYGSERILMNPHHHQDDKKRRNSHAGVTHHPPIRTEHDLNLLALQNLQMGKLSAMDYELLKMAKRGALPDLAGLQEAMCRGGFCEGGREYWGGAGMKESGGFQKSAITTGACTEALSVKKSAEMAALFADIKLSQTTDITHLAPGGFEDRVNGYGLDKSSHQPKYSKPIKNRPLEPQNYPKQAALPPSNYARPMVKNKSKLYSAKNGLYTIQSQSDESRHSGSRRSSLSGEGRNNGGGGGRRNTSSNIEDSLGYLP